MYMYMCMGNKGVKCDQNSPSTDYIHVHYMRYPGTHFVCIRRLIFFFLKLKNSLQIHSHKVKIHVHIMQF